MNTLFAYKLTYFTGSPLFSLMSNCKYMSRNRAKAWNYEGSVVFFSFPAHVMSNTRAGQNNQKECLRLLSVSTCFATLFHFNFIAGWVFGSAHLPLTPFLSEEKQFCNDHHICHVAIVQRINAFAAIFLTVSGTASQCSLSSSDGASGGNSALY